jgi:hypothetical protein
MGPGIPSTPKAVRNYDAVEFRLDKRFAKTYQFAASYTYSRLYGNYSGLASSDENGRNSPNVNRYFDQPWVGVMENGQYAYGRLATDRPHTLKFFGGYTHRTRFGATTLSPIVAVYSGVPITTEAAVVSSTPSFPYGRGDLGRTPFFHNFDLNLMHDFTPVRGHEQIRARLELTVFNLFNNATVLDKSKGLLHPSDNQIQFQDKAGNDVYANIFKGFNARALMKAQDIRVDPQYGLASRFQTERTLRLQFSFFF